MKHFVLGNGESRLQLNLQALKETGRIYGCNALYRNFEPDALIAVDGGMMHEIGVSGYIYNHLCYFRSWSRLPEYVYDSLVEESQFEGWHDSLKSENDKNQYTEFIMNGTDPNQIMRIFHMIKQQYEKRNEPFDSDDIRQKLGNHHQWITWVDAEDRVMLIPESYSGWSAGPIAVRMMLIDHKPEEVFMIGFDMNTLTGKVNNVYKGTSNYVTQDANEIPSVNWKKQHIQNFQSFPETIFYHVSPNGEKISEWSEMKNVKYINFENLQKRLDIDLIL